MECTKDNEYFHHIYFVTGLPSIAFSLANLSSPSLLETEGIASACPPA
jgi:hypothetical protein